MAYASRLGTPLCRFEPGVSVYIPWSTGALFICMTGDSDSSIRPLVWWAFDDGGFEFASIVEAEPLGAVRSTTRRCPAGVW
jgi:hypothetical protein